MLVCDPKKSKQCCGFAAEIEGVQRSFPVAKSHSSRISASLLSYLAQTDTTQVKSLAVLDANGKLPLLEQSLFCVWRE